MDESIRNQSVSIDLSMVDNSEELQEILKEKLEFPDFYGKNWAAFWDAITGLVELPEELIFIGWRKFKKKLPGDSWVLRKLLKELNKEYPKWGCKIIYK